MDPNMAGMSYHQQYYPIHTGHTFNLSFNQYNCNDMRKYMDLPPKFYHPSMQ